MKTGRSTAGDRRKTPMKENDSAGGNTGENWEQQLDYPVPLEGSEDSKADGQQGEPMTREDRIRLKAYQRAEQRGFNGGNETEDWLVAEREVDGEDVERGSGALH